jgi:NTE family protein
MNAQDHPSAPEFGRRRIYPSILPTTTPRRLMSASSAPDRIVTVAALSNRLPDRFIAERLAQTLRAETGASVLLVGLQPLTAGKSLEDWARLQPKVNGEFALTTDTTEGGLAILTLHGTDGLADRARLDSLLRHCLQHFHYIVLHAGTDAPESLLMSCIARSTRTFLLLQPRSEDLYERDLLLRDLSATREGAKPNVKTIMCREKGEDRFNEFLKRMGNEVHGFVHGCPSRCAGETLRHWHDRDFNADIRRLSREVSRRRVGLALSSGGARGLAHVGVIQVLEENGIEVDVIAGCSMGSYVGAVWAYGYDGVAMERLAREVEHRWGLLELIDPFVLPRQGFLRGEKIKRRLKRSIGDTHFSELIRPLRVVATHLASLGRVVLSSGEVAQAVHASSAIPGACVPVNIDGELCIDGGISDPLPVDVLEEIGIERIIAVNTIPTPDYLRSRVEIERERDARHGRRRSAFKHWLNTYLNYFAPGNILDTILRSFNGAQMRVAEFSSLSADLVLRPLSFDGRWHDFRRPGKYIAIGRREAENHLDAIKALVAGKQHTYERPLTHHSLAPVD